MKKSKELQRLRCQLEEALREVQVARAEARTCHLTGVGNARAWSEELDRRTSNGEAFAVILFDLANFKAANDTLGHVVADRILADVGKLIRSEDCAVRQGGDEFAVILSGADRAAAAAVRDRIENDFGVRDVKNGVLVFLAGDVATWSPAGGDLEGALVEADTALEARKRNRKIELGQSLSRAATLARVE